MSKKLKDRLRDPVVDRCGQAGDLGEVGLHQPPQVTQGEKIKINPSFWSSTEEATASLT